MSARGHLIAGLAVALALPAAALAQYRAEPAAPGYRDGQPMVMTPPARPDPNAGARALTEQFRRWYEGKQRPAMLIFWNRELTDYTTGRTAGGGEYAAMDPMLSDRLENAFQDGFLASDVKLVDRNAVIRRKSLGAARIDRPDTQFLETQALDQGIEYLIEVLPNASAQSSTGTVFRVKVTHLPTSTIAAQFLTRAQPPAGESHWVATPHGFEKRREDHTSPETIAAELALETMGHMAR